MQTSKNTPTSDIKKDLFGRYVLTASPPKTLDTKSIALILNDVIPLHDINSKDIEYLRNFYRGNQPILYREKPIRPEIKNTVLENRAFEIVEFKKGYEFSNPVQYTNVSNKESAPVDTLNTYARVDGKESKDLKLAEWFYIAGTSYRICLPKEKPTVDDAPFYTMSLDPRYTFVVYSNEVDKRKLFSGTYVKYEEEWIFGIYTDDYYFTWTVEKPTDDFTKAKSSRTVNTLKMNPIVEYPLNEARLGYVELCLHLFNAINTTGSNRIDGLEQFVQSLLVFINCELPTDKNGKKEVPRSGDAIDVKSYNSGFPADVKYLVSQLNQNDAQVTKEDLLNALYEISGVPSRADRRSGGDTGQAVILRDGWGAAEARAKSTEKMFKEAEMNFLKIVLKICRTSVLSAEKIKDLTLHDIDVKCNRNRSDNMQVKAQTLQTLLNCGVHPEEAYNTSDLFGDALGVWEKSKVWQDTNVEWVANKLRMGRKLKGEESSGEGDFFDGDISN